MSPMNSRRTGCGFGGRIEVDDAAADAELAVLVHRILGREAGHARAARQAPAARSRSPARASGPRRSKRAGSRQPRQQRARRRDDQPRRARRQARAARARARTPPRGAARGRGTDPLPATETAARVRRTSCSDRPWSDCQKQTRVGRHLLDVRVGRHDEQTRRVLRERPRRETRSRPASDPVSRGRRPVEPGACRGRLRSDRNAREDVEPITDSRNLSTGGERRSGHASLNRRVKH